MSTVRSWLAVPMDLGRLADGWRRYRRSGDTSSLAYQSLIRLFCTTRGYSNDILSSLIALKHPPVALPPLKGVLGKLSDEKLHAIVDDIKRDGYHVFDHRLPADVCDRILTYCTTHESTMRPMDGALETGGRRAVYNRERPEATRYDFEAADILANRDIQCLLGDVSLVGVAQSYLGCQPILDVLGLWWHTAYAKQPQKEAAQFFHFDMDRIKWMKYFIYLTDVTAETGPHTFVKGSHVAGQVPAKLLSQGYSRLEDREVGACYAKDRFVEFTAPRGTIIAEDTRGLHKGKHVSQGDRLIISIQFSNTLFGATYKKNYLQKIEDYQLREMIQRYPYVYRNYLDPKESASFYQQ